MIAKAPIEGLFHGFDGDLDGGGLFAGFGRDDCAAIFDGDDFVLFDPDDICIAGDELNCVRDLADELVVADFFENELLMRFGAVEGDGGGEDG